MLDPIALCVDTTVAFDDLACRRVQQCTLCGLAATWAYLWPVRLQGRFVGMAFGLCRGHYEAMDTSCKAIATLFARRYGLGGSTP